MGGMVASRKEHGLMDYASTELVEMVLTMNIAAHNKCGDAVWF